MCCCSGRNGAPAAVSGTARGLVKQVQVLLPLPKEKEVVSYTVFLFCPLMYPFIPKKAVRNADHTLVLYSKS